MKSGPHDPRYERWRWTIFGITWLAYVGFYFTRKAFPVAKIGILEDPGIEVGKSAMGAIDGVYGIAYAIGQFLWGMCVDRFGTRRVVLGGMALSILVTVVMGLSAHVFLFGILFFLQGFCQSTGWAPLTKNISYWFSQRERGRVFGFWTTNYAVGGMVASAFAGYMALVFDNWRFAFFMSSLVLAAVWVLFYVLQKDRPEDVDLPEIEDYHREGKAVIHEGEKPEEEPEGSWKVIREVFLNPIILRIAVVYFLLKPSRYAILFWGPVIVYERLGTNIGESAIVSAAFEAAGPLGAIFAGYATDKWFQARRMPVVVTGLILLSIALFSFNAITSVGGQAVMACYLFMVGFLLFGPDTLLAGACAVDFGTKKGAGSAVGLINGMGSTGQILGLALPGIISVKYGWNVLFVGLAIGTLVAALILLPKWNSVPPTVGGNNGSSDGAK